MKRISILCLLLLTFWACNNDDEQYEIVNVAKAITMSKAEFRNSVDILPPKPIEQSGKVYVYNDYIFVNDEFKGVHIIDNSNPESPNAIGFIKIPGNEDISIKNNYLFADSATDLVVLNISDINNIVLEERLKDVFSVYNYVTPANVRDYDYGNYNNETDVIIGWEVVQERREIVEENTMVLESGVANTAVNVGTGGSLARFQIVNDYLYTVGNSDISIFNISNLKAPNLVKQHYAGWRIETMFHADDYLYLGSTNGMYIYNIENAESPEYISEFIHWEGCDPVVVDGNYAYLTLRGGNACGQQESVLEVIDISNKTTPTLAKRYTLANPYGLGIKDNLLFVCDGSAGLKVFDKTDPLAITTVSSFETIKAIDVIPLDDKLIMIGDQVLYNYKYVNGTIVLLSKLEL